ncbi:MAG: hypothetical protein MK108_04520 [Mariniblastus sp.]|nr:hypothetical protein [Mariniblastus sp.]
MSRSSIMTNGILLVLFGFQLNLVDTYVMTPQFTGFWNERFSGPLFAEETTAPQVAQQESSGFMSSFGFGNSDQNQASAVPVSQASFSQDKNAADATISDDSLKQFTPPSWICWPLIFLGAVLFLHGAAFGRDN